jgi:hypothetical protein
MRSGFMRGFGDAGELTAGTDAGIEASGGEKLSPGGEVVVAALALRVGSERTARAGTQIGSEVRAFLPADAEPAQVFDHGDGVVGAGAVRVEVFVAKDERAAGLERAEIRGEEGARVSEMEQAGGGRRDAPAITHRSGYRERVAGSG